MPVAETVNPALGTKLYHSPDNTTYTAIAQITSIDGPGSEYGTRETTNLDSTAKTFAKTLFDGGEISFEIEFDPKGDTHANLVTLFYSRTQKVGGEYFKIVFADSVNGPSNVKFLAIITGLGPSGIEPENNLMASIKLKATGTFTWA